MNPSASTIPLWLKIAFTAFMFVLVPVYWANYGPTNFLYFCDVALFLVLAGIWTENPLLVSLPPSAFCCRRCCGAWISWSNFAAAGSPG